MKPVALRAVGEIGGTASFMAAITHLPLANTSAIFQALPLAITLGAALVFAEPVGWRRWLAITAGFIGVLIIVRPGIAGFNQYSLFALISVLFCALRDLATRQIPAQIPSLFITLLMTVIIMLTGAVIVFPLGGWTPLSARALGLLALAAMLVLIGYQCVIMALRSGDISAVAPSAIPRCCGPCCSAICVRRQARRHMLTGASIIVLSGSMPSTASVRERPVAATTTGIPPDGCDHGPGKSRRRASTQVVQAVRCSHPSADGMQHRRLRPQHCAQVDYMKPSTHTCCAYLIVRKIRCPCVLS